jgi:hypothetical protein
MKKLRKTFSLETGPVTLSLPDLQEIVDALNELPDSRRVNIFIGDYELSNLNEALDIAQKIARSLNLEYVGHLSSASYSLCITETSAQVACSEDNPFLRGVSSRTCELLRAHRRKWWWTAKISTCAKELGKLSLLLLGLGFLMNTQAVMFFGILASLATLIGLSL